MFHSLTTLIKKSDRPTRLVLEPRTDPALAKNSRRGGVLKKTSGFSDLSRHLPWILWSQFQDLPTFVGARGGVCHDPPPTHKHTSALSYKKSHFTTLFNVQRGTTWVQFNCYEWARCWNLLSNECTTSGPSSMYMFDYLLCVARKNCPLCLTYAKK